MNKMKTRKLGVVLLALLLASIAIVPMVSAQNNITDISQTNHFRIDFDTKNITNYIAYDVTSKANLSSYGIQKPEELTISSQINKFDVVTINHALLNDQLKSGKGITISIGGKDYETKLSRMNFENIDDGVDSYHGTFPGINNSDILFTTGKNVLFGRVTLENETSWIIPVEPLKRAVISESPLHIIYNSKDVHDTEFPIDSGSVKVNSENPPINSQDRSINLQPTPPDQTVYVNILVVTDQEFMDHETYWVASAQNIIAEANRVLSIEDIRVQLEPFYDADRRERFSNSSLKTEDPLTLLTLVYLPSDLNYYSSDIVLYLGGNDKITNDDQGSAFGFTNPPVACRYAWAQMVPDGISSYFGTEHGREVVSIHEIGHMFDAGHETRNSSEPQYARAFGMPNILNTVVYSWYFEFLSVTSFSSNGQGIFMGDDNHDNSRRISETRDIVANYADNDKTGVYRPGTGFFLKMDNGNSWNSTDLFLTWDNIATDRPIAGDWNGERSDKTGVYRPGTGFYLKMDQGTTWNSSTDVFLAWDNSADDFPIAGDWNMDGRDETGVYRPGTGFFLKMDNGNSWNPSTDVFLAWDNGADDLPIAGDWNMDGRDETGVYRPGTGFYLKMDQGTTWNSSTDVFLAWDNGADDLPIAGDWNWDGRDETGVYRPGAGFYLKMDNGGTWNPSTDVYLAWDNAYGDLPIAGNFVNM